MSQEKDDITYLLRQISEGNASCFEKMYKRYFKKCYSIAVYFVQSTLSAEDVLSEVFLTLWNKIMYLQPIITQYFIDNKSEIWLLFLIAHSKR